MRLTISPIFSVSWCQMHAVRVYEYNQFLARTNCEIITLKEVRGHLCYTVSVREMYSNCENSA